MFSGFFDTRNSSFMALIIFGTLGIFVVLIESFPQYQTYLAWSILPIILGIPLGLQLNARFQGPPHPHIEHSIFDAETGIAYHIEDFFVDFFDPVEKVPDIYEALRMDKATGKMKRMAIGGRWWHPYLVRTRWSVDAGDYKNCFLFLFVLPDEWDNFMLFGRRPQGAFAQTEIIDHGTSTHVDSILVPFPLEGPLGVKIPIFLSFASRQTVKEITKTWKPEMTELARYIPEMEHVITDYADKLFPAKELEEIAREEFPVILKEFGGKKKVESGK